MTINAGSRRLITNVSSVHIIYFGPFLYSVMVPFPELNFQIKKFDSNKIVKQFWICQKYKKLSYNLQLCLVEQYTLCTAYHSYIINFWVDIWKVFCCQVLQFVSHAEDTSRDGCFTEIADFVLLRFVDSSLFEGSFC